MSNTKNCPKCRITDFTGGDGYCKACWGSGIDGFKSIADSFSTAITGIEGDRVCEVCSGTCQCQTCGGEGVIYLDDNNQNTSESNYNTLSSGSGYNLSDSNYNASSSGSDYNSSSSYRSNYNSAGSGKNSGCNDKGCFLGVLVLVMLGIIYVIIFKNNSQYPNNNKSNIQQHQNHYENTNKNQLKTNNVTEEIFTISNPQSIISPTKLRTHPNTFRGVVGILNYGVQVDNDLNNLFWQEFNVRVDDETLKRFGFEQTRAGTMFSYKYIDKPLSQKDIYEHLDIEKAIIYLKSTATPEQLNAYNNLQKLKNDADYKNNEITHSFSSLENQLLGNWEVVNEDAVWHFEQNGKGYSAYRNNNPDKFNWNTDNGNLNFIINKGIYTWIIKSNKGYEIELYSESVKRYRTIRKK